MATAFFTVDQEKKSGRQDSEADSLSALFSRLVNRPFLSTTRSLIPHILCQKNVSQLPKLFEGLESGVWTKNSQIDPPRIKSKNGFAS